MADVITDLSEVAARAAAQHDDYEALRYYIEDDLLSDTDLDALVDRIAAPIIAAIDCTTCANCCRNLTVYLTPADVDRLAEGLGLAPARVEAQHIDRTRAAQAGEWGCLAACPCTFLQGTRCGLYAHRPGSCRAIPPLPRTFAGPWRIRSAAPGDAPSFLT
ncbi:MAG: YkgJ family cysteine cluster protein [Anaerolineae bacterium]|nr:YkgJ family cysteine cluster protein [Anaerolineae bacterium]